MRAEIGTFKVKHNIDNNYDALAAEQYTWYGFANEETLLEVDSGNRNEHPQLPIATSVLTAEHSNIPAEGRHEVDTEDTISTKTVSLSAESSPMKAGEPQPGRTTISLENIFLENISPPIEANKPISAAESCTKAQPVAVPTTTSESDRRTLEEHESKQESKPESKQNYTPGRPIESAIPIDPEMKKEMKYNQIVELSNPLLPQSPVSTIHRIGRTIKIGLAGAAVTSCAIAAWYFLIYTSITTKDNDPIVSATANHSGKYAPLPDQEKQAVVFNSGVSDLNDTSFSKNLKKLDSHSEALDQKLNGYHTPTDYSPPSTTLVDASLSATPSNVDAGLPRTETRKNEASPLPEKKVESPVSKAIVVREYTCGKARTKAGFTKPSRWDSYKCLDTNRSDIENCIPDINYVPPGSLGCLSSGQKFQCCLKVPEARSPTEENK